MLYERALLDKWDAYAVKKTAEDKLKNAMEALRKSKEESREEGMKEGWARAKEDEVRRLILKTTFTDAQVAEIGEVTIDYVKKIHASLRKKK